MGRRERGGGGVRRRRGIGGRNRERSKIRMMTQDIYKPVVHEDKSYWPVSWRGGERGVEKLSNASLGVGNSCVDEVLLGATMIVFPCINVALEEPDYVGSSCCAENVSESSRILYQHISCCLSENSKALSHSQGREGGVERCSSRLTADIPTRRGVVLSSPHTGMQTDSQQPTDEEREWGLLLLAQKTLKVEFSRKSRWCYFQAYFQLIHFS